MIRTRTARVLAVALLSASLPVATLAQDETPRPAEASMPEGIVWHLTSYELDGPTDVPWMVDPTLLLEDGTASGSGGCNRFSGSYTLDGSALTFEPAMAVTLAACPPPADGVEQAYLAALGRVASWAVDGDVLRLTDAEGSPLLEFEQAVVALTASDVAALAGQLAEQQTRIDRLTERIDNVRIGALRDRIKALEGQVQTLQQRVRTLASRGSAGGASSGGGGFSSAENVLLRAIPARLRGTCAPLRSRLPSGTVAAITCDTASNAIAEAAYYLMEYADAAATLRSVTSANGVPNRRPRCDRRAGWWDYGAPVGAEACWVEDGTGNFRLVAQAASCHQLQAGGTRLTEPVIYLALEGRNARMEPLRAAGLAYTDADVYLFNFDIARAIPHGSLPLTPACRSLRSGG